MRPYSRTAVAAVLVAAISAAALPSWSADLDRARQLMARGQAAAAYALLLPELQNEAGKPEFDYVFGLAASDSGHPADAAAAFERVLAVDPGQMQARAELGRAYIALNEPEAARRELDTVNRQGNVPRDVRETLNKYIAALDTGLSGGGTRVSGNVVLSGGYDSNINNSTDDSRILIPAFAALGTATLAPSALSQEDGFGGIGGRLSVVSGIAIDTRFIADVTANYRFTGSHRSYDQGIFGLSAGFAKDTPDDGTFTLTAQAQTFLVGGSRYRDAFGALGQWTLSNRGYDYGAYLQYLYLTYPTNKPQDAHRYTMGFSLGHGLPGDWKTYLYGGLYGGQEITADPAFNNLSYNFGGGRIGLQVRPTPRWAFDASAVIEADQYRADEPLFLKKRATVRTDLDFNARYALADRIWASGDLLYTNANSNIPLYKYNRVAVTVSLGYDF
jgi:hypothetical protein